MIVDDITWRLITLEDPERYEDIALIAKISPTHKEKYKWRVEVVPAEYVFDDSERDDNLAYPVRYTDYFKRKPSDKDILEEISYSNEYILDWREYLDEYCKKTK